MPEAFMASSPPTPATLATTCPFCAIVARLSPAHWVLDEPDAVAFLDARPVFPGHVLLVPRAHVETLGDLPGGDVGPFFQHAQRIARAVEDGLGADGTFVAMNNKVSQKDGLKGFFWPRRRYASEDEAAAVAGAIRASLAARGG
jgi:histidine triad (HIT) family protein